MFNASRLTLARQRLGLTRTKLADSSGVSLRSLTEYEKGIRQPSDENLAKLTAALRVPAAFFARDSVDPVPLGAVSFRKLTKTSATRRNAVLASATLVMELFAEIDDRFRLPDPSIPSLDKVSPHAAAELIRREWNLGDRPISNLLHLLEMKGVRVASIDHQHQDIDAFCFYRDSVPYIFLNTGKTAERQRFDAAHELGHLVLHGELDMDAATSRERESEAHAFASSFLMPAAGVLSQSMSGASTDRILKARSYWKVSAMAMTHRLHDLELLTDWQARSAYLALQDLGYRKSEPGGMVPETSQLLRKVMFGSDSFRVRAASQALDLYVDEIEGFVRHLVPVSA